MATSYIVQHRDRTNPKAPNSLTISHRQDWIQMRTDTTTLLHSSSGLGQRSLRLSTSPVAKGTYPPPKLFYNTVLIRIGWYSSFASRCRQV